MRPSVDTQRRLRNAGNNVLMQSMLRALPAISSARLGAVVGVIIDSGRRCL